jgi:hypothetical protein
MRLPIKPSARESWRFSILTTVDENGETPDLGKRKCLLDMLESLGRPIPTSGSVYGVSRWGEGRWMSGCDETFDALRSGNPKHNEDALIGHTALKEEFTLITNERRRLANRAKSKV